MGSKYPYQALNSKDGEIRILYLSSSPDPESEIECRLVHYHLEENPQFMAISYVWGEAEAMRSILLDGVSVEIRQGRNPPPVPDDIKEALEIAENISPSWSTDWSVASASGERGCLVSGFRETCYF